MSSNPCPSARCPLLASPGHASPGAERSREFSALTQRNERKPLYYPKNRPRGSRLGSGPSRWPWPEEKRGERGRGAAAVPSLALRACQGRARRRLRWAPRDPLPLRCCPDSAAARCPEGCEGSDSRPLPGCRDSVPGQIGHPRDRFNENRAKAAAGSYGGPSRRATPAMRLSRAQPGAPSRERDSGLQHSRSTGAAERLRGAPVLVLPPLPRHRGVI